MFKKSRVYLDWAAATPLSKEASTAMQEVLGVFGNPSAIHAEGQRARNQLEEARKTVARTAQIKPEYVTFTSGGTEANNIAIIGLIEALHAEGREYADMHIVTTKIEHPSVTNAFLALEKRGVAVDFVDVDEDGRVQKNNLRSALMEKTVLFSTALINSEIGTIQPTHHLNKIIKTAEVNFGTKIFTHLDAAQAPYWMNCQFDTLGVDLVSLDFGKCGGPKGSGALLRSRRVKLSPVMFGGGQEDGLRSGTENVIGVVGGAAAFAAAQQNYKTNTETVSTVRDKGIELLKEVGDRVIVNGAEGENRVANNINISIPGIDTEYLAVWLDSKGYAVSTKSACSGAGGGESVVVRAISDDIERASSTLRITLGPETSTQNLIGLAEAIHDHINLMSTLQK